MDLMKLFILTDSYFLLKCHPFQEGSMQHLQNTLKLCLVNKYNITTTILLLLLHPKVIIKVILGGINLSCNQSRKYGLLDPLPVSILKRQQKFNDFCHLIFNSTTRMIMTTVDTTFVRSYVQCYYQ